MKNAECRIERRNKIGRYHIRAGLSRAIRHSLFVILLFALLIPALTFADSANRWLLIFDTSSSMRSRTRGTEDMAQDLLMSGMHGQLHHGDTIGIWTFSDKLHAGEAPLQIWSPQMSQTIARHTLQYLDSLRYGKSANMQIVLTNLYAVVDSSEFITVILFSDGDQQIKGTPFDDEINKVYKENYHEQKKAGMPFITVLQAKRGNFTTNTVNFGHWPIDIPAVPAPPSRKPPVDPQAAPKPAQPTAPPIIFDGRKSQGAAPDNTTLPPANNTAQLAPPVVTQPPATTTPAENPPATQPAATAPTPPPVAAETPQPPATPPPIAVATPPPAATPPGEVAANNQPESKPAAAPVPPPVANESQPPPAAPAETANNSATTSPPVETATAVPPPNLLSTRNLAIASVAFAAIVCGLLLMAARNARKAHSSLITRSLDREQR